MRNILVLNEDPTLRNLLTTHKKLEYTRMKGEIIKDKKIHMRPKLTLIGRIHGLPKIPKQIVKVLSFW